MQALIMTEIYQYSRALARNLNEFFFIDHTYITGKQIVEFSEIKQINWLIMKNIFEKWQFEKSQWQKSAFFAYQHPEVQKSLLHLQNTLSNHIEINKENFYPLILEAIQDTLILILDPERFFQNEIAKFEQPRLQVSDFEGIRRFIEFNKNIFQKFMLEINNFPSLSPIETAKILKNVCESMVSDDIHIHLKKFEALMPLDIQKMLPNVTQHITQIAEQVSTQNVQDIIQKTVQNTTDSHHFVTENPLETKKIEKIFIKNQNFGQNIEMDDLDFLPNTLHEKIAKNNPAQTTVSEKFEQNKNQKFNSLKAENIKKILPIHERFLFANTLFGGNTLDFNDALDKLDVCNSADDAQKILYEYYAKKYTWDLEKEETKNFIKLVLGKNFLS